MPADNGELVRSLYVRFEQGDVAGFLAALDPEIAWTSPATLPWSRGAHAGVDEVAAYLERIGGTFETVAIELDEIIDAGDDVFALCRMVGRLPGATEAVELPTAIAGSCATAGRSRCTPSPTRRPCTSRSRGDPRIERRGNRW